MKDAPEGETFDMKYPNSSLNYVKINNSNVIGKYVLSVSGLQFYHDSIKFDIISETQAKPDDCSSGSGAR